MIDRLQQLFPKHHRDGNILLINADCMDVMKHIKENEFDLACVDPPYGVGAGKRRRRVSSSTTTYTPKNWDDKPPSARYFNKLRSKSKHQIIWGGNYFNLPPSRFFWCGKSVSQKRLTKLCASWLGGVLI